MTKLKFFGFMDYEDGKIARVETTDDEGMEIPINIFIDNADEFENVQEGPCTIEIFGIGNGVKIYSSDEAYNNAEETKMAPISIIPMGTFPANDDWAHFEQSPHILFSGRVLNVEWDPSADPDEENCNIMIETLGFTFNLYLRYEGRVEVGYIVHGVAWLFGDMTMDK
jgi:hypothetical protein